MRLKPKWLRDLCSLVFTLYYLVCAERADEVVRKVRGKLSLEHMRVSWNKGTTPYLAFVGRIMRPAHLRIQYRPRQVRIPRPKGSQYTEPIHAWLYFDGPLYELKNHDKVIMDIPGGGFVAWIQDVTTTSLWHGPRKPASRLWRWITRRLPSTLIRLL